MALFEGGFVNEFEALSRLVKEEDEYTHTGPISKPTPAAVGPKELLNVKVPAPKPRKDPKEIWSLDEVQDVVEDDVDDGREVPHHEFMYKQAVESTDMFLGMSGKDESSTSCEDLVVKVELPECEGIADLDLDVKPTYLKLNTTQYKLHVYLPHKVNDDKGKAKWDKAKRVLYVTLPIIREDFF